jgi:RND family efflux transporter MFP subunit
VETSKLEQLKIEREPETRQRPRRWPIWLVAIAVLAAVAYWFLLKPEAALEVSTAVAREVSAQSAATVLNASGYVTARRQATVSSKFTGKVTEVLIEEGMRVEAGQVLARLDDSNIRTSYELALAQLESARTSLKETDALLKEARANLSRTQNLLDRGLSSEAEMDSARAAAESLEAQYERKQADVRVAGKQVAVYEQQLEDTVIRAPFAGVIVAKNAQPGEMISPVSAGGGFTRTGIGTIVDMASLEIEIDVNEAYINRVQPGQETVATLDAYPDWQIPCHVIAIIPTADRQRATVEVRVGFYELDPRILPDMGVKVAFQESGQDASDVARPRGGVLAPKSAIQARDGKQYVWVVAGGVAERRAVATGMERGQEVIVVSGLGGGERVIVNAPQAISEGARVEEKNR